MKQLPEKHAVKIRFILTGGCNTIIDFTLLFLLTIGLGTPKIIANTISTFVAFIFSFVVNRKFTFQSHEINLKKQIILFTVVTLSGIWVLQNIVIFYVTPLLGGLRRQLSLLIAKIIATIFSLLWNFILYSKIVFRN